MKKIQIITLLLFLGFSSNSQNLDVEIRYLDLINTQQDKYLIKDNLRNAELVADSLLWKIENYNDSVSLFFIKLAESYRILKNYEMALYTINRQRILFWSDSLEKLSTFYLTDTYHKCNLNNVKQFSYVKGVNISIEEKIIKLFATSFFINSKEVNIRVENLIIFYEQYFNKDLPYGMIVCRVLNSVGISHKKQIRLVNPKHFIDNKAFDSQEFINNLPPRITKKVFKNSHII